MDGNRFDQIARSLSASETRRQLLRSLAGLPLVGLLGLLQGGEEAGADGRRRRRKKRHKHGEGRHKEHRKGKRGGKRQGKGNGKTPATPCQPEPIEATCVDACGSVENTCGEAVDCDPCGCPAGQTPCGDQCYVPGSDCVYCEPSGSGGLCTAGVLVCVDNHQQCTTDSLPDADLCDGLGNDGDGIVDEGSLCPAPPNATGFCRDGQCGFACLDGFGNCDGNPDTGCETDLRTDVLHCGACGSPCTCSDGAIGACGGGLCACAEGL